MRAQWIDSETGAYFEARTVIDELGCWIWQQYRCRDGYGRLGRRRNGRHEAWLAHRLAFVAAYGPIPDSLTVDHLCFTPPCCNPEHLRLLDQVENSARHKAALADRCHLGHVFDEANTYTVTRSDGRTARACRACGRRRERERTRRRAAAKGGSA